MIVKSQHNRVELRSDQTWFTPDVLMVGGEGKQLLFYSGLKVQANTPVDISVPIDPYYWTTVSGGEVDRETLMVVLNSLEGLYIRAR